MNRYKIDKLFLYSLAAALVLGCMPAAGEEKTDGTAGPVILAPEDQARLGVDDTPCLPHSDGPCYQLHVRGRVPEGQWPYLVVAPLRASPNMWVQPLITVVRRNGVFEGLAFLGTAEVGGGQRYNVFILTHADKDRFEDGQVLTETPEDCKSSDPITVLRTR